MSAPSAQTRNPGGWALAVDRAPQFLMLILLFGVPLFAQARSGDPTLVKKLLPQILLPYILFFWLLRILTTGRWVFIRTPALWPGLLLVGWGAWTAQVSPTPAAAWAAFADWFWVPLAFFLIVQTCHELWRAENLLATFLTSALLTSLWGIAQALRWTTGPWQDIVQLSFAGRVIAGMTRPEYLASFLLLVWPLALALAVHARSTAARIYWGLTLGASLVALTLTRSEFGWIGAWVGWMVLAVLLWRFRRETGKGWAVLGAIGLFLLLAAAVGPPAQALRRLADARSDTWRNLTQYWAGASSIVRDRPWTGSGFGTFRAAFPAYSPASLSMRQTKRLDHISHARNGILEWWSETGTVGLVLLILFWVAVARPWWKLFSGHAIPPPLGAAFFAAVVGNLVFNLFSAAHAQASTLLPLLFLGALSGPLSQRFLDLPGYPIRRYEGAAGPARIGVAVAALAVLVVAFAGTRDGLNRAWAAVEMRKGWELAGPGQWDQAIAHYEKALSLDPRSLDPPFFLGIALNERERPEEAARALQLLESVEKVEPDFLLIHVQKAKILDRLYREADAAREMKRAIELEPLLVEQLPAHREARAALSQGRWAVARGAYESLLKEHPTNPLLWLELAQVLYRSGERGSALQAVDRALDRNPEYLDALRLKGEVASDLGRMDEVARVLAAMRRYYPGQPWIETYAQKVGGSTVGFPGGGR